MNEFLHFLLHTRLCAIQSTCRGSSTAVAWRVFLRCAHADTAKRGAVQENLASEISSPLDFQLRCLRMIDKRRHGHVTHHM